jgi:DNA-binding transcriptional regulator PaaX
MSRMMSSRFMGEKSSKAPRATSLQNSVWISPDPLAQEREILGGGKINVESLILLEARPCASSLAHRMGEGGRRPGEGGDFAEIVAGAWDFERINRRYARHLKVLAERPGGALRNDAAAKALLRWAAAEREAWLDAVTNDPLLPGRMLPSDDLGQQARWPPAKAGGGWKCCATPAGNCARSTPKKPAQTARDAGQPFVAYATKGWSWQSCCGWLTGKG